MSARMRQAIALVLAGIGAATLAQSYDISWYTVDGGGGRTTSTGGGFELTGTIGQPDAQPPPVMSGGNGFSLTGGFWPAAVPVAPPCVPCDTNCDGSVNGFDIQPFVALLSGTGTPCAPCAGDANADGSVNGFDIQEFVNCLSG